MDRTKELNGKGSEPHIGADSSKAFYLADSATGERHLIREMTDAQLASFRVGIAHISTATIKALLARFSVVIPNPLDATLCMKMFEQALSNATAVMVIEYEQNRRPNLVSPVVS